jgi:hypothetical protein
MAKADYFCCDTCDSKVMYDGHGNIEDELAARFDMRNEDSWKIKVTCHICSKDGDIHISKPKETT